MQTERVERVKVVENEGGGGGERVGDGIFLKRKISVEIYGGLWGELNGWRG